MVRTLHIAFLALALSLLAIGCKKPEEKLAGHIEEIGEILDDNKDAPKDGVEEVREYMQSNLPEMLSLIGEMAVELDKIEDPKEKSERAKEMSKTLEAAVESSQKAALQFAGKVMEDKDAQEYLEKWGESWEGVQEAFELAKGLGDMM